MPGDFWSLTPAELKALINGHEQNERGEIQKIILLANAKFYAEPLKIKDFYPETTTDAGGGDKTKEQQARELEKLKEEF